MSEKPSEPEPLIGSGDEKEDEDLDGVPIPLDGAALLKSAFMRGIPGAASSATESPPHELVQSVRENADSEYEDDIDGIPREFIVTFDNCFVISIADRYIVLSFIQWKTKI